MPESSVAWGLPPLLLAAIVYVPITRNYFASDDFLHLYQIADHTPWYFLAIPNGGHIYATRNAVFLLTNWLFGTWPEPYFWCAWITHLVNVWLLFDLTRRLTVDGRLACVAATLFGTCPLAEGSLGFYSVYGHALATTAALVIFDQVARLAERDRSPGAPTLCLWYALALVGATSFGVGIGVALVLPFVLLLLLPASARAARVWVPFLSLLAVIPILYVVLIRVYAWVSAQPLSAIDMAAVLTLPYLRYIPLILFRLIGLGLGRLLFGFVSPAPWEPWISGVLEALLVVWLAAVAWRSPGQPRRTIAAYALLAIACYGMIVVGRAAFLYGASAELLATNSRYHYLGLAFLAVLLALGLAQTPAPRWFSRRAQGAAVAAWLAFTLVAFALIGPRVDHHAAARAQVADFIAAVHREVAAQPAGTVVYIRNRSFLPLPNPLLPPELFPGWAAAFTVFFPRDEVDGRRVRFVEPNRAVLGSALRGARTRALLVAAPGA